MNDIFGNDLSDEEIEYINKFPKHMTLSDIRQQMKDRENEKKYERGYRR